MQSPVSHELGRKLVSQAVSELKAQGLNGTSAAGFVFDCIRHPIKCATKAFNSKVGKATITYISNIANDLAAQRTMDVLHGRSTIRQALTTLPTARETLGLLIRNFPRAEAKQLPRRMRTSMQLDFKRHRKLAGSHPKYVPSGAIAEESITPSQIALGTAGLYLNYLNILKGLK